MFPSVVFLTLAHKTSITLASKGEKSNLQMQVFQKQIKVSERVISQSAIDLVIQIVK